jgi:ribosomal protein S12 methylthiotransferase accessory factor
VPARALASGDRVWVPALAVFLTYPPASPGEYLCPVTSNGLAAGATRAGAVLAAALEVVERDAFMATWLHRFPCDAVDPAAHPDAEVRGLHELYRRRGVELRLFRLPADHSVPVYAAVGFQEGRGDGPAAVVGMGADLDGARAARKALLEVAQIRPALRRRMRTPAARKRRDELVEDPHRVDALEDHDLLYADPRALGAFEFLLDRPVARTHDWGPPPPAEPGERLSRLVAELGGAGHDVLYVDLTPPDLLPLHLYTVRALVPAFQPIDFGWNERRLGGTRLYELPGRLGLAPGVAPGTLNDAPHPVS